MYSVKGFSLGFLLESEKVRGNVIKLVGLGLGLTLTLTLVEGNFNYPQAMSDTFLCWDKCIHPSQKYSAVFKTPDLVPSNILES